MHGASHFFSLPFGLKARISPSASTEPPHMTTKSGNRSALAGTPYDLHLQPKDGAERELEQQADVHTDHVQLTRAANGEEAADTQRCAASSASVQAVHGCPAGDLGAVPAASEEE